MIKFLTSFCGVCALLFATGTACAQGYPGGEEEAAGAYQGAMDRGTGLHFGPLRISPEVSFSYCHDFNPTYSASDAQAVDSVRMQPLLDLVLNGNGWDAFGRGWLTHDFYLGNLDPEYQNTVEKAHYGETLGFSLESPRGTRFSLTEAYEYQNRNNTVTALTTTPPGSYNASWQDRYSFTLGSALDLRLGEKTGMSMGASYSDLWYDNPALFGWKSVGGTLGFSRKFTEKSDLLLSMGYDTQWSDGSEDQSHSYCVLVGVGSSPTAKSSYRAEIGAMGYDFNGGEDTAISWTYNLSGNWRLSQRLSANVSGTANFQPSETDQNNYTMVQSFAAGLTFEATRRLTTSLQAVYRREDYAKTDALSGDRRIDDQVSAYGRVNYRVWRYTSVFVGADVSKNVSAIDTWSYDRLFLETGVTFRF
ncbi:MAG: hypothetical protein WCI17_05075 [bacterium]